MHSHQTRALSDEYVRDGAYSVAGAWSRLTTQKCHKSARSTVGVGVKPVRPASHIHRFCRGRHVDSTIHSRAASARFQLIETFHDYEKLPAIRNLRDEEGFSVKFLMLAYLDTTDGGLTIDPPTGSDHLAIYANVPYSLVRQADKRLAWKDITANYGAISKPWVYTAEHRTRFEPLIVRDVAADCDRVAAVKVIINQAGAASVNLRETASPTVTRDQIHGVVDSWRAALWNCLSIAACYDALPPLSPTDWELYGPYPSSELVLQEVLEKAIRGTVTILHWYGADLSDVGSAKAFLGSEEFFTWLVNKVNDLIINRLSGIPQPTVQPSELLRDFPVSPVRAPNASWAFSGYQTSLRASAPAFVALPVVVNPDAVGFTTERRGTWVNDYSTRLSQLIESSDLLKNDTSHGDVYCDGFTLLWSQLPGFSPERLEIAKAGGLIRGSAEAFNRFNNIYGGCSVQTIVSVKPSHIKAKVIPSNRAGGGFDQILPQSFEFDNHALLSSNRRISLILQTVGPAGVSTYTGAGDAVPLMGSSALPYKWAGLSPYASLSSMYTKTDLSTPVWDVLALPMATNIKFDAGDLSCAYGLVLDPTVNGELVVPSPAMIQIPRKQDKYLWEGWSMFCQLINASTDGPLVPYSGFTLDHLKNVIFSDGSSLINVPEGYLTRYDLNDATGESCASLLYSQVKDDAQWFAYEQADMALTRIHRAQSCLASMQTALLEDSGDADPAFFADLVGTNGWSVAQAMEVLRSRDPDPLALDQAQDAFDDVIQTLTDEIASATCVLTSLTLLSSVDSTLSSLEADSDPAAVSAMLTDTINQTVSSMPQISADLTSAIRAATTSAVNQAIRQLGDIGRVTKLKLSLLGSYVAGLIGQFSATSSFVTLRQRLCESDTVAITSLESAGFSAKGCFNSWNGISEVLERIYGKTSSAVARAAKVAKWLVSKSIDLASNAILEVAEFVGDTFSSGSDVKLQNGGVSTTQLPAITAKMGLADFINNYPDLYAAIRRTLSLRSSQPDRGTVVLPSGPFLLTVVVRPETVEVAASLLLPSPESMAGNFNDYKFVDALATAVISAVRSLNSMSELVPYEQRPDPIPVPDFNDLVAVSQTNLQRAYSIADGLGVAVIGGTLLGTGLGGFAATGSKLAGAFTGLVGGAAAAVAYDRATSPIYDLTEGTLSERAAEVNFWANELYTIADIVQLLTGFFAVDHLDFMMRIIDALVRITPEKVGTFATTTDAFNRSDGGTFTIPILNIDDPIETRYHLVTDSERVGRSARGVALSAVSAVVAVATTGAALYTGARRSARRKLARSLLADGTALERFAIARRLTLSGACIDAASLGSFIRRDSADQAELIDALIALKNRLG